VGALRRRGVSVTVVLHELYVGWQLRPDLLLAAAAHRAHLSALLGLAHRVVVTTHTRLAAVAPLAHTLGALERIRLVPVGSNALPVARTRTPGAFRLGLFSTIAMGKRFDVALGAFERVARVVPHAEFMLIGDLGEASDRRVRRFLAQVAGQREARRITVTGKLSLPHVAEAVASLDVFLFVMDTGANTRSGTLPLPLGCGVPVVAVSGSETDPLFLGDENVVFARELSADAFAAAALRLWRDPQLAASVAAGARRLYETHLTWPRIVSQLVND
jgi:glycosyltransferase involved in cell wall biosynthesis